MSKDVARPAMREDDPREAAKKRAAEILGDGLNFDDGADEFRAPRPPDGWDYEWKRKSTLNQEDRTNMNNCARTGWTFVPAERHPEMMEPGAKGAIERKGLVLMERPLEITQRAREVELAKAKGSVQQKEQQAKKAASLAGREDSYVPSKINKSYEPIQVPDK